MREMKWGSTRLIRLFGIGLAAAVAVVAGFTTPAAALDDIIVPVVTITVGDEGDVIQVAEVTVDAEFVGDPCDGTLIDTNNESVHPNNDLIITSGDWTGTIPDVESEADSTQVIEGSVILGETVVVEIRLGPDGVSSGGLTITFDCENPSTQPPLVPQPCDTDANGNPAVPDEDGNCPIPPPEPPCDTDANGNPAVPDEDGNCPIPPLQPGVDPPDTPTLPVTGVESSLLMALTGLFVLAAGWALVLRPGAPQIASDSTQNGEVA